MTTMLRKEGTAYHEAGHGVVAVLLGLEVCSLSAEEEGDFLGFTTYTHGFESRTVREWFDDADPENVRWLRAHLVSTLAGWWAEKMATGQENDDGASGDRDGAADLALRLGGDGPSASNIADEADHEAEQLLSANWNAVEAVAAALIERGTLTCQEVVDLVASEAVTAQAPTFF